MLFNAEERAEESGAHSFSCESPGFDPIYCIDPEQYYV